MSTPHQPIVGNDIFAYHGRQIIARYLAKKPGTHSIPSPFPPTDASSEEPKREIGCVGILGAGAAGLYTALILDDLGIPFKVIEGRDRVGGRLYTHTFKNEVGAPYNYYDVGAMRFPETDSMSRVFRLFCYPPLNQDGLALEAKLKPFFFNNENAFLSYNGYTFKRDAVPPGDPFKSSEYIQDVDPTPYIAVGPKAIMNDVIKPFVTSLLEDLKHSTDKDKDKDKDECKKGWEYLMKFNDYSTRAYMALHYRPSSGFPIPDVPLPADVIDWCETFEASTEQFDRALTDTVLNAIAHGWNIENKEPRWFCIDGGAFQIADTMHKYLKKRPNNEFIFNKRVSAIKLARDASGEPAGVDVTADGVNHNFSRVISTIPLPVLRTLNLSEAGLSSMQSQAIRTLNYNPVVKIGMQFRTAWWTLAEDTDGNRLNIIGGQTYSDTPLRTVVYPSFGEVQAGKTTTLIASYCRREDADRLVALTAPRQSEVLKELVLRELSRIHKVSVNYLEDQLIETFAWSWTQDPYSMGAFALFGPGKFQNVYTSMTKPAAEGHLHFASEVISVRHRWVEGALDSAWRAIFSLLWRSRRWDLVMKLLENWGMNAEWFAGKTNGTSLEMGSMPIGEVLKDCLLVQHIERTYGVLT